MRLPPGNLYAPRPLLLAGRRFSIVIVLYVLATEAEMSPLGNSRSAILSDGNSNANEKLSDLANSSIILDV